MRIPSPPSRPFGPDLSCFLLFPPFVDVRALLLRAPTSRMPGGFPNTRCVAPLADWVPLSENAPISVTTPPARSRQVRWPCQEGAVDVDDLRHFDHLALGDPIVSAIRLRP